MAELTRPGDGPLVDAVILGVPATAWLVVGRRPIEALLLAAAGALAWRAARTDHLTHHLPNRASVGMVVVALAYGATQVLRDTHRATPAAIGIGVGLLGVGAVLGFVRGASRGRLGAGDVKFGAALGAVVGSLHPFYAVLLALGAMVAGALGRGPRPFGPSLARSAAVALLVGPAVLAAGNLPVLLRGGR